MNFYRRIMAEYGNVWGMAAVAVTVYLLILAIGCGLSYTVIFAKLNYLILLIYIVISIVLAYCPDIVVNLFLTAGLSGIIQEPQTIHGELKSFFLEHFRLVAWVILFSSLPFVFLANVPIYGNFLIFLGLLGMLILMGFAVFVWKIKGNWVKNLVFYFLLILIIGGFVAFIPKSAIQNMSTGEIPGAIKTWYVKFFQKSTTYKLPSDVKIYRYTNKIITLTNLKYSGDSVDAISLNETIKQNGAIYEKFGLPDPKTGQPGAIVGWIFSSDLDRKIKDQAAAKAKAEDEAKARAKAKAEEEAKARAKAKAEAEAKSENTGVEATEFVLNIPAGGWQCVHLEKGKWQVFPANVVIQFGPEKFHKIPGGVFNSPGKKITLGFAFPDNFRSGKVTIKKIPDQ